jgi:3-hydroxymyristoyl/3-hydroxydecanoyl-(acyl carrier protein) dehydratase
MFDVAIIGAGPAGLLAAKTAAQPGDQMDMEVKLLKYRRPLWKMRAEASVAGEIVAEAELSAMEVSGEKLS